MKAATLFGLACLAALNRKLHAIDLLFMANRRPRLMFACFLLGCMGLALTIGLLDVFVLQADAIKVQGSSSAGLDLALGVPLLAIGALLAFRRPHRRRRAAAQTKDGEPPKRATWARRVLREPRFGLAVLIGVVVGTPGASYITALHLLVTGKGSTAAKAVIVVVFVLIERLCPRAVTDRLADSARVRRWLV